MNLNKTLTNWYSINKRNLPWRRTQDPYQIWLSEIILQQTQVNQGLPYFERFIEQFPTVHDLARASESEVLKLWQGLGYYSRARNLHHTAKQVVAELNGVFPNNYEDLKQLKGVGDYTASAIASICFDEPSAVVDGNVFRFLARYYGIQTPINTTKGFKEFKELAQAILPDQNCGEHNQAIMEFGARQCKPSSPLCHSCPLSSSCVAFEKDLISMLPVKLKKTKVKKRFFNYLVFISEKGETVIQQRKNKGIWQNLYEFPLIETTNEIALSDLTKHSKFSELTPMANFEVSLFNEDTIIHKLSHQHIHTKFWIIECEEVSGNSIKSASIRTYPVSQLMANFIEDFQF